MARPREHDELTAEALLEAAERIVGTEGLDALSVRRVAFEVGTTTRAVYSLFGSKDGLVSALGTRAFTLLADTLDALPATGDPAHDLVEAGVLVFRRFALERPTLFALGYLGTGVPPALARSFRTAQEVALGRLHARIGRLAAVGRLGQRSVADAGIEFDALCEGLVKRELCGVIHADGAEHLWRDALRALVRGWGTPE
jgi:AcrR family transcriptional regulator